MCPNLSDPLIPTWRGKEDREAADDKSGAHHGCPCCVPGSGVLGLNATSDILDPVGPPLVARGSPRLPPGTPSNPTSHQTQSGSRGTSWSPCCTWLTSGTSKYPQKSNMSLCPHERLQRTQQFSGLL